MAFEGQFGGALAGQILAANSLKDLEGILFQAAADFGFPYIWCGAHADPFNVPEGAVLFQNYPDAWISEYVAKRYYNLDPVFRAVESRGEFFTWENLEFLSSLGERQFRVLNEARQHGIVSGLTFPLNRPGCVGASCSIIPRDGEWRPSALTALLSVVWVVYGRGLLLSQTATANIATEWCLSPRERDCLRLQARGSKVDEIGKSLGIADTTVRRHLDRAQARLSARTRAHAVAVALRQGQIS